MTALELVSVVHAIIADHLSTGRGFSLVRIGDGEGYVLRHGDDATPDEVNRMFQIWFGRPPACDREIFDMKSMLEQAIRSADVIGVHAPFDKGKAFTQSRECINRYFLRRAASSFCNANIHYQLLEGGFLNDLVQSQDFVGVVTPRNVVEYIKVRFGIRFVDWYELPEEAKYRPAGAELDPHYPDRFQQIISTLRVPYPGALFLVGAGPLGKVYCRRIKELGGVALDIGSVFDAWGLRGRRGVIDKYAGL